MELYGWSLGFRVIWLLRCLQGFKVNLGFGILAFKSMVALLILGLGLFGLWGRSVPSWGLALNVDFTCDSSGHEETDIRFTS